MSTKEGTAFKEARDKDQVKSAALVRRSQCSGDHQ